MVRLARIIGGLFNSNRAESSICLISMTLSSLAPGSPVCISSIGCASSACAPSRSSRVATSAERGIGIATPARAATPRASRTPFRSRPSWSRAWEWTERYATQPEILRYARHVADHFDLRRDIRLTSESTMRSIDEPRRLAGRHGQRTDARGRSASWRPAASRCPSCPTSRARQTSRAPLPGQPWPHEGVDFHGQRVGMIGTGSSGIQADPGDRRAGRAPHGLPAHANFSVPAENAPLDGDWVTRFKEHYRAPATATSRPESPASVISRSSPWNERRCRNRSGAVGRGGRGDPRDPTGSAAAPSS